MSTNIPPLVERLCRCLAVHVIETEGQMQFMDSVPEDLAAEVANARALIAEAGFDLDVLYPESERPQFAEG